MHIKRCIETDGKTSYGFVDLGTGVSNDSDEASSALIYMLVALNGYFRILVAYYFIHSLAAEERANITREILCTLHDFAIDSVRTFTFDGTSVNISSQLNVLELTLTISTKKYFLDIPFIMIPFILCSILVI